MRLYINFILLALTITLKSCKAGDSACMGNTESKLLDSFFATPTQTDFAKKVKLEKLQQVGYINQYHSNYVIKYNWGQHGPCYGFYTFNGTTGELEQARYYWGDSIRIFEDAISNTARNKLIPDTSLMRYECFEEIYNAIDKKLSKQKDMCGVYSMPDERVLKNNYFNLKFKSKHYIFKKYFAEVDLSNLADTGSFLKWELDYREKAENTVLCK